MQPLLAATRSVPIVFVQVTDPVGAGLVASLARPGGNITGFLSFEYGLSGKWLELHKQIVPGTMRAAIIRDPDVSAGIGQFAAIASAAPSLGVDAVAINVKDPGEIERALAGFARSANAGMIVTGSAWALIHRDLIVKLAAQHKLPAIYYERSYVVAGGLISYGSDFTDQYRQAAGYVDRILRGEKPGDLPVQAPTKYELLLVINLKIAKALGLEVPATLLARADEVVEYQAALLCTSPSRTWPQQLTCAHDLLLRLLHLLHQSHGGLPQAPGDQLRRPVARRGAHHGGAPAERRRAATAANERRVLVGTPNWGLGAGSSARLF
jgi:ABC-type uncharacterized transport system substrate-binding protein